MNSCMRNKGLITGDIRNRGNLELSKRFSCSVHQGTKVSSAEERDQVTSTPYRVRQESTILSPSKVGFLSALKRHSISSKSATLSPSRVSLLSTIRKLGIPRRPQYSPAEPLPQYNLKKSPQESWIILPSRFWKLKAYPRYDSGSLSPVDSGSLSPTEYIRLFPGFIQKVTPHQSL